MASPKWTWPTSLRLVLPTALRTSCISTAQLKIKANEKPGTLQIHALNQGQGPILISIDTLRKLKAVIDFSEDLMVLRASP
jgi:hypothetical protein